MSTQYYIHNVPGRLRLKSPVVRKNQEVADEIKKMLGTMNGIAVVEINLVTGSILINYNPKTLQYKDIISLLQKKGYFDMSKAMTNDKYFQDITSSALSLVTLFI